MSFINGKYIFSKIIVVILAVFQTQIRQVATCGTTFDDAEEDSAPPSYTETR